MMKFGRIGIAVSLGTFLIALPLTAMAQQPQNPPGQNQQGQGQNQGQQKKPPVQGQANQGPPGQGHPGGPPGQFHGAAPAGPGGPPGQFHAGGGPGGPGHQAFAVGQHGYSFRGAGGGRRDIGTFSPHERSVWIGGGWRHERHFGRVGYWWVVNGVWYYYDQPFAGPPAFVSEVEFVDEAIDPGAPVMMVQPPPPPPPPIMVAPAPVVVVRPPPPPPIVCVGPLCVR